MNRRTVLAVLGTLPVGGCLGQHSSKETLTPGRIDFPSGPKDPPERPSRISEAAVQEYVKTHEYRYVYNSLWASEYTDVDLACRVDSVEQRAWGYEVIVTCTGHSNTNPPANATGTSGPHADWFTQSFRYRVSENTTQRHQTENRDPVS